MKHQHKLFAVLSAALSAVIIFSGCIKQKTLIKLNPDGSGNIVVSAIYNKQIVDQVEAKMKDQKEKMGNNSPDMDPFYNVDMLKRDAKKYGDGVEYVKSKKVNNEKGRGYIAIYSFAKISDVKLDLKTICSPMPTFGAPNSSDDECITFNLSKDKDLSKLTVKIPQPTEKEKTEINKKPENDSLTPMTDEEKQKMMMQGAIFGLTGKEKTKEEVIRKMFGGMSIDIDLEIKGKIEKSTASFNNPKKKNRIKLIEIDYAKLLKPNWLCSKIANDKSGETFSNLPALNADGVKIERKPEITLEFKAK